MLCVEYEGHTPRLAKGVLAAPNATAVGQVTAQPGVSLWYGAVVRGDQMPIAIGENTNIQDNAVLHVSTVDPLTLGKSVTVGHGAILHGCTVGDNCLIGMGAVLLNRCVIGENCLVAAGSLVTEGTLVPPGSLVMGSPARVKRPLTPEELESLSKSAETYLRLARGQLETL